MSKNWYIVTNTENLTHFVDYGLIIDEQGFAENSYIVDAMQNVPKGYIPCFSEGNLFDAVQKAKQVDSNLSCCFLQLDFTQIVNLTTWGGLSEDSSISYQYCSDIKNLINKEDVNCILLPAPISFNAIKCVLLENDKTRKSIQSIYTRKFSNRDKFFSGNSKDFNKLLKQENRSAELFDNQEKIEHQPSDININYSKTFAYGGALGLLYYQTKNGRQSIEIFKIFSDLVMETSIDDDNSESLKPFKSYLLDIQASEDSIINIYKLIMDKIINTADASIARYNILNILKNIDISEKYNSKCKVLAKRLEEIIERTIEIDAKTIFESIINKAYAEDIEFKIITLLITMFFLRDNVETMLKYYHTDLSERHYSLLAILFGMSYGIVKIPNEIRKNYELSAWLSYKMAEYAHKISDYSTLELKEPVKPLLLYDDIIKISPTKVCMVHDIYLWIDKKFKKAPNSSLIESRFSFPKKGIIEDGNMNVDGLLDLKLTIKIDILESLIQEKIKEDTLFDFKEIIDAYKK